MSGSEGSSPRDLEWTAIDAARRAGAILREQFRRVSREDVETKGLHDYVTAVDRASEAAVVAAIRERHPDHGVVAEEGSPDAIAVFPRWIVDPLDGTTNFIHGVPTFAVSIAAEDDDGLAAGVVYDPIHDELFHAARGHGARLNGHPFEASPLTELGPAIVATGFPFRSFDKIDGYVDALRTFMTSTSGVRRAGSAAIDLAYTACGRYDGFFEVGLSAWDVAAGVVLVREAGGSVSDCGGGDRFLWEGEIVASGRGIHEAILEITKPRLGGAVSNSPGR